MLVLFESPSGYAIFKVLDESRLEEAKDLSEHLKTPEAAAELLQLQHFKKFEDTTEALAAATAAVEGKVAKPLKKILKTVIAKDAHENLAVADAKLGQAIKEKLNLQCVYSPAVHELMRGIRAHVNSLITGLPERDMTAMALGLAHSLSRYKLKFSPDKVDTMIVQAITLLDDLDKELNNYIMRCREWYGWHFPELGKVVTDHLAFARLVKMMGIRTNISECDLSKILPEEVEEQVRKLAEVSMGSEISDEDILNIKELADQIIEIMEYRAQLFDYLKNRMVAIAPNLTALVGELVGARLIAHAGSLMNLAKHPASTVQILGAEKALFRALKTRKDTPKYGLIYHASLVTQSFAKNKGKVSRMLAAKAALACRCDALGDGDVLADIGVDSRAQLEIRIKNLEDGGSRRLNMSAKATPKQEKYSNQSEVKTYDSSMDSTLPAPKKRKIEDDVKEEPMETSNLLVTEEAMEDTTTPTPKKVKKKKKVKTEEEETPVKIMDVTNVTTDETETPKKKSKKKKQKEDAEVADAENTEPEEVAAEPPKSEKKKKKKKVKTEDVKEEEMEVDVSTTETPKKKKKKKIKEEAGATTENTEPEEAVAETPKSEKKKKKKKKVKTEEEE